MPRKKRSGRATRTQYAWHRRVPWAALAAGVALIALAVLVARSFGIGESAGRYTGPGGGVGDHIPEGQPIAYPSHPPTSGPHWPAPASWGAHTEAVPDERAVHDLEHGGVVASYNNIAPADLAALRDLYGAYPKDKYGEVKLVIRPYDKIAPGTLVLTAWNWIDELPKYDESRVRRFLDAHLNQCCEAVP
ncbi:MAG TPA: DUF3105 domain-containing protein [Candidatus Limnocylindria bacterium]|jgi:hypothetical protein|nr:DUF3105 domain-containing protein [Candidatus Limnocylindria bacterium]